MASYAEFDKSGAPKVIGVVFSAGALDALPTAPSDGHRCFDANNDGVIDLATECSAWHERVLPVPSEASRRADVPFKWALLNWNPRGHIPPGVFDKPHFDVHFYIEPIENIFAIERGTCGPELVRCDQFAVARKPVPGNYVPPNFLELGLVAPAMGNHLVDPTTHEFHGEPFTRHWIYGTYDGRVIFYEEMVARDYMLSRPDACFPIRSPDAVALTGSTQPDRASDTRPGRTSTASPSRTSYCARQALPGLFGRRRAASRSAWLPLAAAYPVEDRGIAGGQA